MPTPKARSPQLTPFNGRSPRSGSQFSPIVAKGNVKDYLIIGGEIPSCNVALTTLVCRGAASTATQVAVELNRPALTPPAVGE